MKKILLLSLLFLSFFLQGQTYAKINALTTLFTIPNVGIETSLGKKSTFQVDATASFWKSLNGKPMEFHMFTLEYRYHFRENYDGFYVGGNVGETFFNFQKWNYLNTDKAELGTGYVMGVTLGYQKKINDRFMLDCFFGFGNHQGFYHGYYISTGERYDDAVNYNKSGEWIPYKGGVMVSYRLN